MENHVNNPKQISSNNCENLPVYYTQNISSTGQATTLPLIEVINKIKSEESLKNKVTTIRSLNSKEEKNDYKKLLPAFSLAKFKDNVRRNENFISTQFLLFDFDKVKNIDTLFADLKNNQSTFLLFKSPGGSGLKLVFRTSSSISSVAHYKSIYDYISKKLAEKYSCEPDSVTKDPARLCFLSHDPDLYYNPDCRLIDIDDIQAEKSISKTNDKSINDLITGVPEGQRNGAAIRLCGKLISFKNSKVETYEFLAAWNAQNNPPLDNAELKNLIDSAYERYEEIATDVIIEKDNGYFKAGNKQKPLTSFVLIPEELLTMKDGDCIRCTVITQNKNVYSNIIIENTDWHLKTRFLKVLGHTDCNFFSSESDLQELCAYLSRKEMVKKTGTKKIGMHGDDIWVVQDMNITKDKIITGKDCQIVAYDKSADALHYKIKYELLDKMEQDNLYQDFYKNILKINNLNVILPLIGFIFATPLKERLKNKFGGFPLLFIHGGQGGGKTSTCIQFMRLVGYTGKNNITPFSCTMKQFPLLKLLSSSNTIPVFLDEYKLSDMTEDQKNTINRFMRKAYSGETESKGRADQSVLDYEISVPLVVAGEWGIQQPALMERMIISGFTNCVKESAGMRAAFENIKNLELEGFWPHFVQYCLNIDLDSLILESSAIVVKYSESLSIAPRVCINLTIMVLGILLFRNYGLSKGIRLDEFNFKELIENQVFEITGTSSGVVKSDVDQMLEEMAIMAGMGNLIRGDDYKVVKIGGEDILAIYFGSAFIKFKEMSRRTVYEGVILDKKSFIKMMKEENYTLAVDQQVRIDGKQKRCWCIKINLAEKKGLIIDGLLPLEKKDLN